MMQPRFLVLDLFLVISSIYLLIYTIIVTNEDITMKTGIAMHTEASIAKIFKNGSSQAVRLPKEYRLQGKTVAIYRLGQGVVLQPIKDTWRDVYNAMEGLSKEDFAVMSKTVLENLPPYFEG